MWGGVSRLGGQGSNVCVLCAEAKEHKHVRPGTRPGGSVTGVTEKLFMSQIAIHPVQHWSLEMPKELSSRPEPPVLDKISGPMGARFLSSTRLGFGNLTERAQFFPVPALDKNRSRNKRPGNRGLKKLSWFSDSSFQGYESPQNTHFPVFLVQSERIERGG